VTTALPDASPALSQAPWPKPGEEQLPRATFAAGCFWGPELHFQRVPGVVSTAVGYTGAELMLASQNEQETRS
jgi:peptide methionine sulfoxide reductase MsrA